MTSIYDVLKASKGLPVNDIFAELWGRKLSSDYTIVVYTGTLPVTLMRTKAGYLQRYKVFGNSSSGQECGERTDNLFNLDRQPSNTWTMDTAYYINGGVANDKTVNPNLVTVQINDNELTVSSPSVSSRGAGFIVPASPSTSYTISCNTSGASVGDTESVIVYSFMTQSGNITRYDAARGSNPIVTLTTNNDEYYVYLVFRKMSGTLTYSNIMLVEGSTAPTSYIPYGYKLPLTSGSTSVDIYIGDDTLSTEEYVDSGTGKIYRMVSGVLTPVDPPVPFPQIPTSANSTTISWAGEGLAPSEVEFEYERK